MQFSKPGIRARKAERQSPKRSAARTILPAACQSRSTKTSASYPISRTTRWRAAPIAISREAALSLWLRIELREVQLQRPETPATTVNAGDPVTADVTVTNAGKVPGDEVVEVYLKFPPVKGAPLLALRGFQRIHLDPGASRQVHFELRDRDRGMVTEEGHPIIAGATTPSPSAAVSPIRKHPALLGTSTLRANSLSPSKSRATLCTAATLIHCADKHQHLDRPETKEKMTMRTTRFALLAAALGFACAAALGRDVDAPSVPLKTLELSLLDRYRTCASRVAQHGRIAVVRHIRGLRLSCCGAIAGLAFLRSLSGQGQLQAYRERSDCAEKCGLLPTLVIRSVFVIPPVRIVADELSKRRGEAALCSTYFYLGRVQQAPTPRPATYLQ